MRKAEVFEIKRYGKSWQYFTRRYCDNNSIHYDRFWRSNPAITVGDLILTDDDYVVPVTSADTSYITFTDKVYDFYRIYFLFNNVCGFDTSEWFTWERMLNVEDLIFQVYKRTLSIRKTVGMVFSRADDRKMEILINEVYRNQRTMRFIMSAIEELFKNAGVDLSDSIKRMNDNANALQKYVKSVVDRDDAEVEDVLRVISASHKLNNEMVSFGLGNNPNMEQQYFLPTNATHEQLTQ